MGNEWRTAQIEEVAEKVACGPFGSSIKVSTFVEKGVPVISGQHLHGTRLEDGEYNYITPEHAEKLSNANVYPGDVVFTHAGNIGQAAFIPEHSQYSKYVLSQRQFYLRPNRSVVLPEFVAYYFHSPIGHHRLLANASQTGVPSIARPVSYLKSIKIPVPPLPEQRAIAHILGSLGDKIELNRRMNETLETTARAIFKSWFVDFDPVRAKAEGGDPGLPDDVAALFPNSFEASELGEIPTGWEIGKLQDILILQRGFDLPKKKRSPGRYPLIAASGQDGFHNEYKVSGPGVATGRSGKLGIVTFVHSHFWPLNTTLWVTAYKNSNSYHAYFLLHTLNLEAYNAGSAVPTLNRNHIHNLKLPVPNDSVLKCFELHSRELFFAIDKNTEQIAHLSQIRDTLLPKLVSGELRVPDAEKFVEEAGV